MHSQIVTLIHLSFDGIFFPSLFCVYIFYLYIEIDCFWILAFILLYIKIFIHLCISYGFLCLDFCYFCVFVLLLYIDRLPANQTCLCCSQYLCSSLDTIVQYKRKRWREKISMVMNIDIDIDTFRYQ